MSECIEKDVSYFHEFRKLLPAADKYLYLNSAGCGPLAMPVLERIKEVFDYMAEEGQVNVRVHDDLKIILEDARCDVAEFIGAKPEEIFFVRCIAEGLNTINRMFDFCGGDEILISDQENPASILPCFVLGSLLQVRTETFSGLGNKEKIIENFCSSLTDKTKMTVISHVFHTTGTVIPAREICAEAKKHGVISVLDGAQAAGNIAINVKDIDCDFYLLSCHKWLCGPEGIAAVYIRGELIEKVRIPFGGVGMQDSFDFSNCSMIPKPDAGRFEYGGRHIPMYAAFSECIRLANTIGLEFMVERKKELYRYCREVFKHELPTVRIISPEDDRLISGIFSFCLPGKNHREVVHQAWEEEKMIIQWRMVDLITGEEGIRISLNWFITETEINRLAAFLKRLME